MYAKINTEIQSPYLLKKKFYNLVSSILLIMKEKTPNVRCSYNPDANCLKELTVSFKTQKAFPIISQYFTFGLERTSQLDVNIPL